MDNDILTMSYPIAISMINHENYGKLYMEIEINLHVFSGNKNKVTRKSIEENEWVFK